SALREPARSETSTAARNPHKDRNGLPRICAIAATLRGAAENKAAAAPSSPTHRPETRLEIRRQTAKRNRQFFGQHPAAASARRAPHRPAGPKAGPNPPRRRQSFGPSRADWARENPFCKPAARIRRQWQYNRATGNNKPVDDFVEQLLVHRTAHTPG